MVREKRAASPALEDKTGLDRIEFFSDAVMAIAITLLVLDLKAPEIPRSLAEARLLPALMEQWRVFLGYILSFAIIGNHWLGHHRLFRPIRRYDYRLVWLNLLFLLFIALLPFSTRLIGYYPGVRAAVVVYSINVLPLGIISYVLMRYAYAGHRLVDSSYPAAAIKKALDFSKRGTVVFMTCLGLSIAFPRAMFLIWFLGFLSRSFGRRHWRVGE